MTDDLILVTGATGYIGGRLVPHLLEEGRRVRVMVRNPSRLNGRGWEDRVDVAVGDVLKPDTLPDVLDGVHTAYYFIHSMKSGEDFAERDRSAARNFAQAAEAAGVSRIIYLGGLEPNNPDSDSAHLDSRHEVGDILREAEVDVTEFQAAVVVGAGSISFEMVRYLTERVPVMITPRWVWTPTQPIAVDDVLAYLSTALDVPASRGEVIPIGGADVQTYGDMMLGYAEARDLKRHIVPVPMLSPSLSSRWVHLVTPVDKAIAKPLIMGLKSEVTVQDDRARRLFPDIEPVDYATAVRTALKELDAEEVESYWADPLWEAEHTLVDRRGMLIEQRQATVDLPPEPLFRAFTGLGGDRGWLYWNWIWKIRGLMDRVVGGPGYRRGRRDPDELRVGDVVDFWRVEAVEEPTLMRLRAEMKLPGRGWLEYTATPLEEGGTRIVQTAYYAPRGLFGWAYWYALMPAHLFIFSGMLKRLIKRARLLSLTDSDRPQRLQQHKADAK
jgi:uncharacterized protein YbjT (DUF2867 family)